MMVEGVNGMKPAGNAGMLPPGEFNPEFEDLFLAIFDEDVRKLDKFNEAVDLLNKVANTSGFVSGRLLNNSDMKDRRVRDSVFKLNQLAKETYDDSLLGITVTEKVEKLIDEFFEKEHLMLINELLIKSGIPFVVFTMDKVQYNITLVRSMHFVSGISIIRFANTENGKEVYIPFQSGRLTGETKDVEDQPE